MWAGGLVYVSVGVCGLVLRRGSVRVWSRLSGGMMQSELGSGSLS